MKHRFIDIHRNSQSHVSCVADFDQWILRRSNPATKYAHKYISSQPDVASLLTAAWETSTKNAGARSYMAGWIDAMIWADG
jgi:hypothetical protein